MIIQIFCLLLFKKSDYNRGILWDLYGLKREEKFMYKSSKISKMTGIGLFIAITAVLTIIGNSITIGPVAINLSLIPITIGSIIFGPLAGFILGAANGVIVLLAPSTSLFLSHNVFLTIVTCILKTGLAGLISGFAYKLFRKIKEGFGVVVASILTPLINTAIFALCVFLFFYDLLLAGQGSNAFAYFALVIVGWNFVFEISISCILCPTIIHVTKVLKNKTEKED